MKAIKIYLIVVSVLLVIAVGFGVYIWYVIQTLNQSHPVDTTGIDIDAFTPTKTSDSTTSPQVHVPTTTSSKTDIVIPLESITDTQRSMLKTFGYTQDEIVITEEMIFCAQNAVGAGRLDEITNGAAPSPFEAVKLATCLK